MSDFFSWFRRMFYWLLPIAILAFILNKIDLEILYSTVKSADLLFYFLGLAFFPTAMLFGAVRWHVLIRQYWGHSEKPGYVLKQYWIALSIGIFLPGEIGIDLYRIAVISRKLGQYTANIAIILEEKLLSLVVCIGLVLCLPPWLAIDDHSPILGSIIDIAYAILVACLLAFLLFLVIRKSAAAKKLIALVIGKLQIVFSSFLSRLETHNNAGRTVPSIEDLFRPLSSPGKLLPVLLLTLGIIGSSVVGNYLFFVALGYELPFVVNIFVVSVLYFVFLLPVSFGGLGVREGGYILLFGLFGVPPEIAFAVSLFALSGVLINYAISGALIFISRNDAAEPASRIQ